MNRRFTQIPGHLRRTRESSFPGENSRAWAIDRVRGLHDVVLPASLPSAVALRSRGSRYRVCDFLRDFRGSFCSNYRLLVVKRTYRPLYVLWRIEIPPVASRCVLDLRHDVQSSRDFHEKLRLRGTESLVGAYDVLENNETLALRVGLGVFFHVFFLRSLKRGFPSRKFGLDVT